jgi:hypothetical protein
VPGYKSMNEIKSNFKHQICYVAAAMSINKQRFGPMDLITPSPIVVSHKTILEATRLMVDWVASYRTNRNITWTVSPKRKALLNS